MSEWFVRKEQKYLIPKDVYEEFMETFKDQLVNDPYSPYEIRSIYFDNQDNEVMNRNLKKPAFKQKIRMRSYGEVNGDSPVFLELKKKLKGTTYKKRITMPYAKAMDYLAQKDVGAGSNTQDELARLIEKENLEPSFYIRYHRKAYTWKDNPAFRLTFDTDLITRSQDVELNNDDGSDLIDKDVVLMELKAPHALPLEVARFLNRKKIYPVNFSKATASYRRKECYGINEPVSVLHG